MILGEVRGCFFQELVLHTQFPRLTFQFPQPGPLRDTQVRLVAGMLTPIGADPVTEGAFLNSKFTGNLSDRTRRLDHQLHGLFPIFRRIDLLRTRQLVPFPEAPILLGSLSGRFGAAQSSIGDRSGSPRFSWRVCCPGPGWW